ncbi:MAG: dehydrogenase [Phycisphaerae bacterium]|nr:dehydrogenase [Phycisphaerae bacterium]|tara:strand:+ start:1735 stop:2562 length:828 start_codon:yes stop_codon:yes gene_type:complete
MTSEQGSSNVWALITGASSGIGEAYAFFLAGLGHPLVLTARRKDRLESVANEIRTRHGVDVLVRPCDLTDRDAVESLITSIDVPVGILINNAGYAVPDFFLRTQWSVERDVLEVLGIVPIRLAHAFAPAMLERGWGRIIHVSSLAAFTPVTPGGYYGPAKTFLVQAARSLSREVAGSGVHVTALCPGFTRTEFHDVLGNRESVDRMPRWMWQEAGPVVTAGWKAVERGREVCVPGVVNKTLRLIFMIMPACLRRRLPLSRMPGNHGQSDATASSD